MRRRKTDLVKVAVVGVGEMGANHARVLSNLKGVDLVGVVDPSLERAAKIGESYGCRAVANYEDLGELDAVTVAAPSTLHAELGVELLSKGIHCLIEKPLATDEAGALELISASKESSASLLVGHIERFNPAVRQLRSILDPAEIRVVNARRMSAVSARITDVDVVADLMVHDLDIILHLLEGSPEHVLANGTTGEAGADHVNALLSFSNNRIASVSASRITQNRIRTLEVITDDRLFVVDYSNQELLIFRQGRINGVVQPGELVEQYVLDVGTERVMVRRKEPLVEELSHFVDVARGIAEPEISGETALAALRLVWEIQNSLTAAKVS